MAVSEWPDQEAAKRFWKSPKNAKLKKLRDGIATFRVSLAEAPNLGAAS